nr:PQQ-like beta-propeller repeat protein [Salsipaludibacter albus]
MVACALVAITGCRADSDPVDVEDTSATSTFRDGPDRPGRVRGTIADEPASTWTVDGDEPVIASPVVVDDAVAVPLGDDQVVLVEAATGRERWRVDVSPTEASATLLGSHLVVAGLDGTVTTLSVVDGSPGWTTELGARVRSSPLLVDGRVVVGTGDEVVALGAVDGREAWRTALAGLIDGFVAVAGDLLVVGDTANTLWGLDAADGTVAFEVSLGPLADDTFVDGIAATPAVAGDRVMVASTNGRLVAVDTDGGEVAWDTDLDGPVYASAALDGDGGGWIATATGTVAAFEVADGSTAWEVDVGDAVYASPTLVEGPDPVLLVVEEGGSLVGLDPSDGGERWRVPVGTDGNYMASTPTVVGDTVVVGTNTGDLVGIR